MDSTSIREGLLDDLRETADEGRAYPTSTAWPIGEAGKRGDPDLISALPFVESLANILSTLTQAALLLKVKTIFDNTSGLPSDPIVGDIYLAKVTANGWTQNNLYTYNSSGSYDTILPLEGIMILWIADAKLHKYYKDGSWINFGGSATNPIYLIPNVLRINGIIRSDGKAEARIEKSTDGGSTWVKIVGWYL